MSPPKQDEDDGGWTTIDHPSIAGGADNDQGGAQGDTQGDQGDDEGIRDGAGVVPGGKKEETRVAEDGLNDLKLTPAASVGLESRFLEGDRAMYTAPSGVGEEGEEETSSPAVKVRIVSTTPPSYKVALPSGETVEVPFDHPGLLSLEDYESLQLQQEVGMLDVVSSELFGGSGGGPFDDLVTDSGVKKNRHITEICIRSGSIIDGIGANYSDGTQIFHGGDGGGLHKLILKRGEYISQVTARYGNLVTELAFTTNTGRTLSCGGKGSLLLGGVNSSTVTIKAPGRFYALAAIFGRSGKYLDAIGFHWGPIAVGSDIQRQDNKDIVTNLASKQHLKTTGLYGNERNGSPFDDGHFNIRITDISVVALRDGPVRGLRARFYNGKEVTHGGWMSKVPNKTDSSSLALEPKNLEYIHEVHIVTNDEEVVGLTFITNKNRTLGPCGLVSDDKIDGGRKRKESVVSAPSGYRLIGFRGTAGDKRLHSIGFNWSPVAKGW